MADFEKTPTPERFKGLKKGKSKKTITAGHDLENFNTRMIPDLVIKMKVYCAKNRIKIQDFVNEAITEKLQHIKK
jgi:hypothetical protein